MKNVITIILSISLLIFSSSCNSNSKKKPEEAITTENRQTIERENPYKDAEIDAVIISSEENTFGYDIYLYDEVLIHQPSCPGQPGNLGFATAEEAIKVADLVIKKLRNNEMPPTVTTQELQELKILCDTILTIDN